MTPRVNKLMGIIKEKCNEYVQFSYTKVLFRIKYVKLFKYSEVSKNILFLKKKNCSQFRFGVFNTLY